MMSSQQQSKGAEPLGVFSAGCWHSRVLEPHCCLKAQRVSTVCKMKVIITIIIILTICLSVFLSSDGVSVISVQRPCEKAHSNSANVLFKLHHSPFGFPQSDSISAWERFMNNNRNQFMPRYSETFFNQTALQQLMKTCTADEGSHYLGNMCMSNRAIPQYVVTVVIGVANDIIVTSVRYTKERVIVVCEDISNRCLPVHFVGQRKPDDSGSGPCQ